MASPSPVPLPLPSERPNRATRRAKELQRVYVGITEAATYLDVTQKTIRKLIASGDLPAYRDCPSCKGTGHSGGIGNVCWFCDGGYRAPSPAQYQAFKREVVAELAQDEGWELTRDEVRNWAAIHQDAEEALAALKAGKEARRAIDACPMCDADGMVGDAICSHGGQR
jgi:hypothetical protein